MDRGIVGRLVLVGSDITTGSLPVIDVAGFDPGRHVLDRPAGLLVTALLRRGLASAT
jgi:hypothetical protein